MKDRALLVVTGLIVSVPAWAFWYYLGNDAFTVLMLIMLIGLQLENSKLRRKLRERDGGQ